MEAHQLAVPDEQSAIRAARAWMAGAPPDGCPYEAGADTSKIAMGGVLGQASTPGGKLHILMYWSAPLSVAQSQWHPFEQDFWGLLVHSLLLYINYLFYFERGNLLLYFFIMLR